MSFMHVNVAVCNPPCRNGGSCTAPNECACLSEWTGDVCEEGVQEQYSSSLYAFIFV